MADTEVLCNRENCIFNSAQVCTSKQIGLVDGQCVTRRKAKRKESYRDMMRPPFNPGCRKSGGSYKSDRITDVLK